MARLVEIPDVRSLPPSVTLAVGDLLQVKASGGRVGTSGSAVLTVLGHFQQAVVAPDGHLVVPAGPPTDMFVLAQAPGRATLEIMSGDPWRGAETFTLNIVVQK